MKRAMLWMLAVTLWLGTLGGTGWAAPYPIPKEIQEELKRNLVALEKNPTSADAIFDLAMSYAYSDQVEEGWNQLKRIPQYDDQYAKKVIEKYEPLSLKEPLEWRHKFRLGFGYYFDNDKKMAKQAFQQILEDNPNHIWAMGYLALIEGEEGNYDTVISLCKRALQIERNAKAIHFLLAQAYWKRGNVPGFLSESFTVLKLKNEESGQANVQTK